MYIQLPVQTYVPKAVPTLNEISIRGKLCVCVGVCVSEYVCLGICLWKCVYVCVCEYLDMCGCKGEVGKVCMSGEGN